MAAHTFSERVCATWFIFELGGRISARKQGQDYPMVGTRALLARRV
jgi:hypothetical protein